jgi:hypothetical protein
LPIEAFIEPNPNYKPQTDEEKAAYAAIVDLHKKRGPIATDVGGVAEAVRNSDGMYRMKPASEAQEVSLKVPELKDMTNDQLKALGLQLGMSSIKPGIKRSQLIEAIQKRLDAIDIVDDTDPVE